MFEGMIQLIEGHVTYGPAMKDAARDQAQLILDYHTHGGPTGYCVAITKKRDGLLMTPADGGRQGELVHIKGVGKEESDCMPLMSAFARKLTEHYKLEHLPLIHLNGRPCTESE